MKILNLVVFIAISLLSLNCVLVAQDQADYLKNLKKAVKPVSVNWPSLGKDLVKSLEKDFDDICELEFNRRYTSYMIAKKWKKLSHFDSLLKKYTATPDNIYLATCANEVSVRHYLNLIRILEYEEENAYFSRQMEIVASIRNHLKHIANDRGAKSGDRFSKKKVMSASNQDRKEMIDATHASLSIVQQCILLSLCRSSLYYQARGESALNLHLMRLMDEHYLNYPFKGSRRMHVYLKEDLGIDVSQNRIDRLYYNVMGLRSILPGPHTSKRCKEHKVYPYLLRDLKIVRSNQVWATDITYIPMPKGFMYLMAIIDLHSRCVVYWSLSNNMEASWCAQTVREAIEQNGKPEIINTDQGSQFTSDEFTEAVFGNGVKLSMDGKGRATDNAFIERLWRSVKYEHVYIHAYETAKELYKGLSVYMKYYNEERRHSSLDNNYPQKVYLEGLVKTQQEKAA